MSESLQYVRKNRGQVSKDVSSLLSNKEVKEVRIQRTITGELFIYYTWKE